MISRSVSNSQVQIIHDILRIHVPQNFIDVDPTYSKGVFYRYGGIQEPKYKFDLYPQTTDTIKACATKIPLDSLSMNCIIFDPPFLATTGPSLKKSQGNIMVKRFGVFDSERQLFNFYKNAMLEFYRILKPKGVLIFKCQDKVSSGKQYLSHWLIQYQALKIGYYPKDLFILTAKNRIIASWQHNQKHTRKYHSYFLVFTKEKSKINYKQLL